MRRPRVVELVRVSTEHQAERDTPAGQRAELDRYRENAPADVIARIELLGVSGTLPITATAEGRRLLELAREGFDELRVYAVDRCPGLRSDDPRHSAELLGIVIDAGATIVEAGTGTVYDLSGDGHLMIDMRSHFARTERRRISERTMLGRRTRVQRGEYAGGGRPPYGYRRGGGAFEVVEAEAEIVREIFARAPGESRNKIARDLNAREIPPPRGKRWHPSTIGKILSHRAYIGEWRTDGIPLAVPAIVSEADFRAAEEVARKRSRNRGRRGRTRKALSIGRVFCPCGRRMYAERRRLRCASRHSDARDRGEGPCAYHQSVHYTDLVDEAIWISLTSALTDPAVLERALVRPAPEPESDPTTDLESQLRDISAKQTRAVWERDEGLMPDDVYLRTMQRYKAERGRIEAAIETARDERAARTLSRERARELSERVSALADRVEGADLETREALCELVMPRGSRLGSVLHPDGRVEIQADLGGAAAAGGASAAGGSAACAAADHSAVISDRWQGRPTKAAVRRAVDNCSAPGHSYLVACRR